MEAPGVETLWRRSKGYGNEALIADLPNKTRAIVWTCRSRSPRACSHDGALGAESGHMSVPGHWGRSREITISLPVVPVVLNAIACA